MSQALFTHEVAPSGQSPRLLHPHCPPPITATQMRPPSCSEHEAQTPPVAPQAAMSTPFAQLPFMAAVQQPPLQGELASHFTEQVRVAASQALLSGQSFCVAQPQKVMLLAVTQAAPLALPPAIGLRRC